MYAATSKHRTDPASVLTKAILRASDSLGMSQGELGVVLGISAASVSRLHGSRTVSPSAKEGELGILFLRVFRSLDSLLGGDEAGCRAWLRAPNHHLGGVPVELIQTVEGLARVVEYLDAMRGKV
jgi:hypothetical protein